MRYRILVGSPIAAWCSSFAHTLEEHLTDVVLVDLGGHAEDGLPIVAMEENGPHFVIMFAEGALSNRTWRSSADLRLFIDASDVDITADLFKTLRTEGFLKEGKFQSKTLAEEVDRILKEKTDKQGDEEFLGRTYADIVVNSDETFNEAVDSIVRYIEKTDEATARSVLDAEKRRERIDRMLRQYQHATLQSRKAKVKRKLWLAVITATLAFKRAMDMLLSFVALLLLSPLFLFVALAIKLHDRGPVFYVQQRVGLQGKEFPFPKFRSMVMHADALKDSLLNQADRAGDVTFKMKQDPRVTPIGRFIRRFSIDELPQLWCVLKGDMSIVGPRPPVPREVALYTQEDRRRLEVKPGLTGIWQVSGRSEIGFKQQVELDVLYIESHGFWLDLKLILKTIPAVLTGKGAY
ncbi:MAG: exopolysaccharide biosynthesis polyprenyl glycosylphosphotransferase [Sphaerochaeta sp.]|jgi:exopolysaccharide biosynthesis polyprenyl glycosylphosphotransferase|nr:exopolysaccharide biosynthesis polyprenyl glycosylphosphotransferase [Sphaerochaeta sp.]